MHDRGKRGNGWTRREVLRGGIGAVAAVSGAALLEGCLDRIATAETFIGRVTRYDADIASMIVDGFRELGVDPREIRGKRILLKPNMIEPHRGAGHINTHPLVVRGASEAFLRFGASEIVVAEGAGHSRDSLNVLEESGLADVLVEDRIPFVDLNYDRWFTTRNAGRNTRLRTLTLPATLREVDWVVSVAKMKTHHWAGVTLSMKNLFGVMPGRFYGWPKNILHFEGIENSILDIHATVKTDFAIIDGIVGMEGDGPIMGEPRECGVLVMGRNLRAVDSTGARIMGIDPIRVAYLKRTPARFGPIDEPHIRQRGETIASVRTPFALEEKIEAHQILNRSSRGFFSGCG